MDVRVGKPFEDMIDALVRSGRYASATEIVEKGLYLVQQREKELHRLRERLQRAINSGRSYTDAEVGAFLDAEVARLDALGFFEDDLCASGHAEKRTSEAE